MWLILNLVQSQFTELIEDEAYYWMYSRFLDWGYYDHPPMVAFLIKLGYTLIPNELGIRLLFCIMSSLTLLFIYKLLNTEKKDPWLYILISSAVILMHFYIAGFVAIPDNPLLFFTTLFLFFYKRYLEHDSMRNVVILSVVIAALLYSKYHAGLLIIITVIANPRIFYRRTVYFIALISLILYLPHIYWQYQNDFVTFRYHLVGRTDPFEWKNVYEFLYNQLIITGPFIGAILLYMTITRKPEDVFEKVMKYVFAGFFGFFLLSTFKNYVEPHWTAVGIIPMIILSFKTLSNKIALRRWVMYLSIATIPFILFIRIWLMSDFIYLNDRASRLFHDKDKLMQEISALAGSRPVVFTNKYPRPSLYTFYTGKPAHTRTTYNYRKSQFDVWNFESELANTPVMYLPPGPYPGTQTIEAYKTRLYYDFLPGLCSYTRLDIILTEENLTFGPGQETILPVEIINNTSDKVSFRNPCDIDVRLYYIISEKNSNHRYFPGDIIPDTTIAPGESIRDSISFTAPETPGDYQLIIATGSEIFIPGKNSKVYNFVVR